MPESQPVPRDMPREERAIYVAMIAMAIAPLIGVIARGGALGGGATLCLLALVAGVIGLVRGRAGRPRVPAARVAAPHGRGRRAS